MIPQVDHVVILMQENRSFDEYFGTLGGVNGFQTDPASAVWSQQWWGQQPPAGFPSTPLHPFWKDSATTTAAISGDNNHLWGAQHVALDGEPPADAAMDKWLAAQAPRCMGYFQKADIPCHFFLAENYTVCDSYFCSVLGATTSNRLYMMSGTIDPDGTGGGPVTGNPSGYPAATGPLWTWPTYPDLLTEAAENGQLVNGKPLTWAIYKEDPDDANLFFDLNILSYFENWADYSATSNYRTGPNDFEDDVIAGTLPTVSWIIPPYTKSEHPPAQGYAPLGDGAYTPAAGASYIYGKLQTIMNNPAIWDSTVFILTYDENDGTFDHVTPPAPPPAAPSEWLDSSGGVLQPGSTAWHIGPGYRVPTILISPWTVGGKIFTEPSDHTSLLQFLYAVTDVEPNLSDWRWVAFSNLVDAFDFNNPQPPPALPDSAASLVTSVAHLQQAWKAGATPLPAKAEAWTPPAVSGKDTAIPADVIQQTLPGCRSAPANIVQGWLTWVLDHVRSGR